MNYILGTDYTVQFYPLDVHGVSNVMSTLNTAIRSLFDRLTSDMAPHDQALPFLQRDRLTPERFLAAVERVVQSNDQFTLNDSVNINVVHVEMPQCSGRKRRDVVNLEGYLRKKDCIVQIKNKDELCCARAIIVAKAKYDKDPQYKSIVDQRCRMQTRLAQELHETSGLF